MVRHIGMDVHRSFAQIAVVEDGPVGDEGRIGVRPEDLRQWVQELCEPGAELALVERDIAADAVGDPQVARLMTVLCWH